MSGRKSSIQELQDTEQTVWQLLAIQLSGWTSLPILTTSVFLLQESSFYGAILTILVGNILLWFIRLGMILMSHKKRQSTLDISRDYLGNFGAYFIGVLLLVSTLIWFIAQTAAASNTLTQLLTIEEYPDINKFIQMSVLLGILSTLFCMEGIVVLRKLSTFAFPILLMAFVVVTFTMPFHFPKTEYTSISLTGLTLILATNLGITADLPTFFRHSRSLRTSIITLTVIQIMSIALAIGSLFLGTIISNNFQVNETVILGTGNEILRYSLVVFVFLSVLCANVANVYSASVGWEILAPSALVGRKEYLILGLGLTTIFILVSDLFPIEGLLHAIDSSLVNLCLVLTLAYMVKQFTKRVPSTFDKLIYLMGWFFSTVINALQVGQVIFSEFSLLAVGSSVILLVYVLGSMRKVTKAFS